MKIETIEIAGLAGALTALRLPFGKEVRSHIDTFHKYDKSGVNEFDFGNCYISIRAIDRLEDMKTITYPGRPTMYGCSVVQIEGNGTIGGQLSVASASLDTILQEYL